MKKTESSFQTASAGFLVNQTARLFAQALAEALKPLDLAPAQFMTLLELWREQGLTQKELVLRLDVEQATMASTLNRMERDGLILRRPDPDDNRAQRIFPTSRAVSLKEPAIASAKAVNAIALQDLSDAEKDILLSLLPRVIQVLQVKRDSSGGKGDASVPEQPRNNARKDHPTKA